MHQVRTKLRVLTYTSLYPNHVQPSYGVFVERRLLRLIAEGGIDPVVVAPVPWVPAFIPDSSRYAKHRGVGTFETRNGVAVYHPRFIAIPGLGRYLAPFAMFVASVMLVRRLNRKRRFDIVDAHYFYPDGVTAAFLAKLLRTPLVVTARGTDVNLLPTYLLCRTLIRWAAGVATHVITVSDSLRSRLIDMGIDGAKVTTLRNGVDEAEFVLRDRRVARQRLGLPEGVVLLSVGNLVEIKGHHLVIEALRELPAAYLVVVGDGEERERLHRLARDAGLSDRVRFTGTLTSGVLIDYYNAADALILASSREGMPNVVLEAVSCGLPVVATNCGGIAEIINRPELGLLLEARSARTIARGVQRLMREYPLRAATRSAAGAYGWGPTIQRQTALYLNVAGSECDPSGTPATAEGRGSR